MGYRLALHAWNADITIIASVSIKIGLLNMWSHKPNIGLLVCHSLKILN